MFQALHHPTLVHARDGRGPVTLAVRRACRATLLEHGVLEIGILGIEADAFQVVEQGFRQVLQKGMGVSLCSLREGIWLQPGVDGEAGNRGYTLLESLYSHSTGQQSQTPT